MSDPLTARRWTGSAGPLAEGSAGPDKSGHRYDVPVLVPPGLRMASGGADYVVAPGRLSDQSAGDVNDPRLGVGEALYRAKHGPADPVFVKRCVGCTDPRDHPAGREFPPVV